MNNEHHHSGHNDPLDTSWIDTYKPLLIIVTAAGGAGLALFIESGFTATRFMDGFMGLFLLILALFKLFDLKGFAEGFALYDLAAKRWSAWGYTYPFIEAVLGLFYLAGFFPFLTNIVTFFVMSFGAIGIIGALLRSDEKLRCACLGTALNLPLGTVSAVENISMALMALTMILL